MEDSWYAVETAREVLKREPLPEHSSVITDAFLVEAENSGRIICLGKFLTGSNVVTKLADEMKLLEAHGIKIVALLAQQDQEENSYRII